MKYLLLLSLSALFILSACKPKTVTEPTGDSVTYACPMKCEGEKVYHEAGKCPVCGMDLVALDPSAASVTYKMNLEVSPNPAQAGQPANLSFTPKIAGNETAAVPLDEVHEKKMHIIIVSSDLGWYDHIHPDYQPDGSYQIAENFPAGGDYIIFADYVPTGSTTQVERITLKVSGEPKKAEQFTTESLNTKTDGYDVKLVPTGGKFITNNMNHLGVDITEKGKPVTNFENIMGAKGHLVIISGDGQKYLHVHPDEVEGKLDLHAQFDQPGIYRAYFQFQTNGKLHTSYFTIDVKEGTAGEIQSDHSHDHKDEAKKSTDKAHDHGDGTHEHGEGEKHKH